MIDDGIGAAIHSADFEQQRSSHAARVGDVAAVSDADFILTDCDVYGREGWRY